MKNKKLFAILTLVCFMMTLMPVAAFAAPTDVSADGALTITKTLKADGGIAVTVAKGTVNIAGKYVAIVNTPATAAEVVGIAAGATDNSVVLTLDAAKVAAGAAYTVVVVDAAGDITGDLSAKDTAVLLTADEIAAAGAVDKYATYVAAKDATKAATLDTSLKTLTALQIPLFETATGKTVAGLLTETTAVAAYDAVLTAWTDGSVTKVDYDAVANASADVKAIVDGSYPTQLASFGKLKAAVTAWNAYKADAENANLFVAFKLAYAAANTADFDRIVGAADAAVALQVSGTSDLAVAAAYVATLTGAPAPAPTPSTPQAGTITADKGTSAVFTVKNNPTVKIGDAVKVALELRDAADKYAKDEVAYIWFTEAGSTLPSTGVVKGAGLDDATLANVPGAEIPGLFVTEGAAAVFNGEVKVSFQRAGEYTLHAATDADFKVVDAITTATAAEFMAELTKAEMQTVSTNKVVTVKGENVNSADYALVVDIDGATATLVDGDVLVDSVNVAADGLAKTALEFTLYESDAVANVVKGETVKIETSSSNIEVSKEEATTNALGKFSFAVSGVREGNYEIYLECGSYEATIKVAVGATAPTNIVVAKAPTAPVNIDNTADLSDVVRFVITDINGNTLTSDQAKAAGEKAFTIADDGIYASIVSAPAGSDLTDEDVTLVKDTANSNLALGIYSTLAITGGLDVEGTYEFKVALNNGKSVYVTVEAKEFGTPVGIVLEYSAPSVELGGVMNTKDFLLVDKNGVTTRANGKVELAASGYAIANFDTTNGTITVKADEKYLGSTITVTAVSERYDLMTSASVKVVAEAAGLMFATKTAEVDVNNAIQVVLVDAQGNRTAFGDARNDRTNYDINYVVLDKPEGAKVAVNTAAVDNNLLAAGSFKMNLTCDKVGTVKVQAVAKITKVAADGKDVVKYYTGIGEIAVGNGQTGKSVVMSIGSNEMIADGKVSTVDAQPMIQNNRTFVPFRALAEAFGATVAYDQATSSVTATLNGVEVVMTVGSPVYTVNGVEKTADVAPFISDSRTFVPVRFAAEAFGITVTPTYNADGSVADVLFNM